MTTYPQTPAAPHRVVIIGGGFGGLTAAKRLRRAPAQVTLLDRSNFHLFQPLLYQVATGALSPANIASPLRGILKNSPSTFVMMAEVAGLDVPGRNVLLRGGGRVPYDTLIAAAGAGHSYFGHDAWEQAAPALKTINDAVEIRARVLSAFERAELETDPARAAALLTFIVVGAGPTGVELAGALAEIAHHTLRSNFRRINPASARILLLEGGDRVLSAYPPALSRRAQADLERMGVTVRLNCLVTDVRSGSVTLRSGGAEETALAHTVLWAAGVQAAPLAQMLAQAAGAQTDRAGRVIVQPDLTLPGHPEIFAIGDMAHYAHQTGAPLPGVAPVAIQQAQYAAALIERRLRGDSAPPAPFRYFDKGSMATIGRAAAVVDLRGVHLTGFLGWLAWLFIHLILLVEFQNRALVLFQWAWNYVTRSRSARLITRTPPLRRDAPA